RTSHILPLSLHDALPIYRARVRGRPLRFLDLDLRRERGAPDARGCRALRRDEQDPAEDEQEHVAADDQRESRATVDSANAHVPRSEEHTSELQSLAYLVC